MMKISIKIALVLFMHSIVVKEGFAQKAVSEFKWEQLPSIPDSVGFAGSFAGVSNDVLLVAGGANFPDGGAPWTGSVKKWHNKIFALEKGAGKWKEVGMLPRPLGYGISISTSEGLICLGGSNEMGHFADVFLIKYTGGKISIENLPSMPKPIANSCGGIIDNTIYIAGGIGKPDSKTTESIFWSLDLKDDNCKWNELSPWPGPSRMLSVAGTMQGAFYVFSGAELNDGKRNYLNDAFKYVQGKGWHKIADLPAPVVAAPGNAYSDGKSHLLIFGGDNGTLAASAAVLKEKHPGFSRDILAYDTDLNSWSIAGQIYTDKKADAESNPNGSVWAPVTTPLVVWNGNVILPGGEVRPATRTPRVLMASPANSQSH